MSDKRQAFRAKAHDDLTAAYHADTNTNHRDDPNENHSDDTNANSHPDLRDGTQDVRLTLQFEFVSNGYPVKKEVILDLEPSDGGAVDGNPIRGINQTTAAIMQLLAGNGMSGEAAASRPGQETKLKLKAFTSREMDVFTHLMTGATNTDIADKLGVSQNTVKFHVKNILHKLDVKNRVELAVKFSQMQ